MRAFVRHSLYAAVAFGAITVAAAASQTSADSAQMATDNDLVRADDETTGVDVVGIVEGKRARTADVARTLWEYAEVGYQEDRSSALLQKTLSDAGFKVKAGVADIPTAFVAEYGEGGPVIAILAEFDALPGINQDATPDRSPIPGKAAGHACGHNLFGAASVEAAIAVREWLEKTGEPGIVRLYGTPAEEGGSGKVYMVRAGLFDDVDVTLHWHADDENSAAARTTLANRSAKFRFSGVSAHAAGAPDKARSALDGVEAMNHMVNLMREHVPQETRIHYVITKGGEAPNVVPDFAEVFYYLRHPEAKEVRHIWERLEAAARGAAEGTGTKVEWEIIHGNHPILVNETLAKLADAKLREVGGVDYTADERAFARKIYASFDAPKAKIGDQMSVAPYSLSLGYGSTDVGDVSIATPTVGLRVAAWVPGTSAHSWQAVAASGHSIGFKGATNAAKALALTAVDLYESPDVIAAAREEFEKRRGGDFTYEALLGDRKPPLDYRK
ncbi:MAG: amidohydrolase [Pseudomonadota bacterium]